jgi:hypothetical protein
VSRQSLLDTATDLEAIRPPAHPRWYGPDAAAWAVAAAAGVSAAWFAQWELVRRLLGPDYRSYVAAFKPGADAGWLVATAALSGLIVGTVAGCRLPLRAHFFTALVWGCVSSLVAATAAVLCVMTVAVTSKWLQPQAASTIALAAIGAVAGLTTYTWGRPPARRSVGRPTWRIASAAGWGGLAAAAAGGMWTLALVVSHLLFGSAARDALLDIDLFGTVSQLAAAGGIIGLAAGVAGGVWSGRQSRLAAGIAGGTGFGLAGAIAGGLCPALVAATAESLPPEVASTLVLGAIGGVVGLVGYTWGRSAEPADEMELTDEAAPRDVEWSVDRPAAEEPAPARNGALIRVAPVLMVSATCLAAMLVSPVSPVGWAMLAIGALGLAVAWALLRQERRIHELEQQLRDVRGRRDD